MTILCEVTKTARAFGRGNDWFRYENKTRHFDTVADALVWIKETYPKNKRAAIYVDTKSRGTIQTGWIISSRDDYSKNYCQDWVSISEVTSHTEKTARSVDVKTAKKGS